MKKLIYLVLTSLGSLLFFSCDNNETNEKQPEDTFSTVSQKIEMTVKGKGEKVEGIISFTVNDRTNKVTSFHFSEGIEDATDMTSMELFNEVKNKMELKTKGEHSDCIEGCIDKYTDENGGKIKGRGRCKANCWVDTAVRVLDKIGKITSVF